MIMMLFLQTLASVYPLLWHFHPEPVCRFKYLFLGKMLNCKWFDSGRYIGRCTTTQVPS